MISKQQIPSVMSSTAYDGTGERIGAVSQLYVDERTGEPAWATVNTGMFGMKHSFVPLNKAQVSGEQLQVPVSKEQVKDAPRIEATDQLLTEEQVAELYQHYHMPYGQERTMETGRREPAKTERATPREVQGREEMVGWEERMRVGSQSEESGKVRLRKHVETENVQTTVPLRHEEFHVEREPIPESERGRFQGQHEFADEEAEMTLHRERPVVGKETYPTERVRLARDEETENEQVGGTVRKEKIDVDQVEEQRGRRR